jgi:hypothetical protein
MPSAAGRIRYIEKNSVLIGIRTGHLPACTVMPQSVTLSHAPFLRGTNWIQGGYEQITVLSTYSSRRGQKASLPIPTDRTAQSQ